VSLLSTGLGDQVLVSFARARPCFPLFAETRMPCQFSLPVLPRASRREVCPFSIPGMRVRPSPTLWGFPILPDSRSSGGRPDRSPAPPVLDSPAEGNYTGVQIKRKPRTNNAILRDGGETRRKGRPSLGRNALPGVSRRKRPDRLAWIAEAQAVGSPSWHIYIR
jgi:hypothetical protein